MTRAVQAIVALTCAAGALAGRGADPRGAESAVGPPDSATGAALFSTKGCVACHTIGGGVLVGPDLAGVSERREPAWLAAMIARPDSMLLDDPVAQALRAAYGTAMPRLGIATDEASALVAYLSSVGEREEPSSPGHCPCPRCTHGYGRNARAGS